MAGRELAVRKSSSFNLREEVARATLREIHRNGHVYVELREAEAKKRIIFFCTLCLTPCFNDSTLFDHLHGNLHKQMYAAAKVTLFGPVPWPFNDGVRFFFTNPEQERYSSASNSKNGSFNKLLDARIANLGTNVDEHGGTSKFVKSGDGNSTDNDGKLGLVKNDYGIVSDTSHPKDADPNDSAGGLGSIESGKSCEVYLKPKAKESENLRSKYDHDRSLDFNSDDSCLMIPGVFLRDEVSILRIRLMGFGHIASRVCKSDEVGNTMFHRIWCAWLGDGGSDNKEILANSSKCDYAVVNFTYSYDLGTKGGMNDMLSFITSGSGMAIEDAGSPRKRIKKSFSEPEGTSEGVNENCDSSGEDSPRLKECSARSPLRSDLPHTSRRASEKAKRRELRRLKRQASERICDICAQPMLPGKDVASLLNLKTGNLACISRNAFGAFHIFHTSCLIHWILLCEYEIWNDKPSNKKNARGRKSKTTVRTKPTITYVFCPQCHGTGSIIEGDRKVEKTLTIPPDELFLYKLKAIEAQKSWMKNPEILEKCSTGLLFPLDSSETTQEKVFPPKLLHFYQAET